MATNIFANITQRGTQAKFKESLATVPNIWSQFCQMIPSDAPDEEHVWLGMVPDPREFINGRNLVGIRDFTYNIKNKEYELSAIIDQTSMEDDRHGLANERIAQMAQTWATYRDVLFASVVNSGATSGYTTYDAVTFFNASHVIGAATPDNALASTAPTDPEALTVAEMKVELRKLMLALQGMQDDTAREGYNWSAMSKIVVMGNQQFEQALMETINATLTGGGDSNPYFLNIADPIINPFLGVTNDYLYLAALGDPQRLPFICQERTPLQIEVFTDPKDIALNHGVLVLARQRYRIWYGEPRRMVRIALT